MTSSRTLSSADLQTLRFPRRELPGKLLAITLVLLLPERQSEVLLTQAKAQPKFKIGDLIAADWVDEFDKNVTDFGEILGARYLPVAQSCFAANTWVYYINWTHTNSGADSAYPCYDGEATKECELRLVKES